MEENYEGQIEIRPWVFFHSRNGKEKFKQAMQSKIQDGIITCKNDCIKWIYEAYKLSLSDAKVVADTYYKQ